MCDRQGACFVRVSPSYHIYTLSLHDALPISDRGRELLAAPLTARCSRSREVGLDQEGEDLPPRVDRKSTRLNSSHLGISYAGFCLKKKSAALAICRRPPARGSSSARTTSIET